MSRKLIGLTTLAAFMLAVTVIAAVLLGEFHKRYLAERVIEVYDAQTARMAPEVARRHRDLARWYNFCLTVNDPASGHQETYKGILDISDGMMGYLSFSGRELRLPLYHGASLREERLAAGHVPGSALPVGGLGNHTVLTVSGEASDLEEGDVFSIHIPGEVLHYRVREVKRVSPGETRGILPVEGEDLCTLTATVTRGKQAWKIMIHGVRTEGEQSIPEPYAEMRQILHLAGWVAAAVLVTPLVTGGIGLTVGFARKRAYRRAEKHRA